MPATAGRLDALDDPAYTTGRAAEIFGVRQAFLRSLDAADAVTPQRIPGGRRRYSRRQLAFAARLPAVSLPGTLLPVPSRRGRAGGGQFPQPGQSGLTIPVREAAKPRSIQVTSSDTMHADTG
ncbi:MAG TPA: hypothetical protein VFX25_28235 [Streptosporangiaceae bacterium]|nr:hypothetical protein [Streptosporangiaceae bacterium]